MWVLRLSTAGMAKRAVRTTMIATTAPTPALISKRVWIAIVPPAGQAIYRTDCKKGDTIFALPSVAPVTSRLRRSRLSEQSKT
jgi:hypothetical protein